MKIKLDENLPERLMAELAALGHDVDTVRLEQLTGRNDGDVWSATQTAGRFPSRRTSTSDLRRYAPGTHAGLLVVRLAHPGRQALFARVETWHGCLVIATDHKVRVKRSA